MDRIDWQVDPACWSKTSWNSIWWSLLPEHLLASSSSTSKADGHRLHWRVSFRIHRTWLSASSWTLASPLQNQIPDSRTDYKEMRGFADHLQNIFHEVGSIPCNSSSWTLRRMQRLWPNKHVLYQWHGLNPFQKQKNIDIPVLFHGNMITIQCRSTELIDWFGFFPISSHVSRVLSIWWPINGKVINPIWNRGYEK